MQESIPATLRPLPRLSSENIDFPPKTLTLPPPLPPSSPVNREQSGHVCEPSNNALHTQASRWLAELHYFHGAAVPTAHQLLVKPFQRTPRGLCTFVLCPPSWALVKLFCLGS